MLKRFAKDESGNFAIFTGLFAAVLIGALGGVLDLSKQWTEQEVVQRAADAAALAGAKALEAGTESDAQKAIQIAGQANLPEGFPSVVFTANIDQTAGTVTVDGNGSIKPYFLNLFQISELSIGSSAQALIQRKSYIDFYFLLDMSESMNIAASNVDRANLEAYTAKAGAGACAFACHTVNTSINPPRSWYDLSREAGVKLRIDVLRDAAKSTIDKVLDLNNEAGGLRSTRVATAGFNTSFSIGTPPTIYANTAKASIENLIDASGKLTFEGQHSNIRYALPKWASAQLTPQGNGASDTNPKKFAVLITDGVRDDNPWFSSTGLGPIEPSLCDAIKSQKIELAVLDVKYIGNPGERFFEERVASYYAGISKNLKECASPGLYYQATDAGEAQEQLSKLIDAILTVRRRLSS